MLSKLEVPDSVNYVGCMTTLGCNIHCAYCVNDLEQANRRDQLFPLDSAKTHSGMSPEQWIAGLSRLQLKPDVPVTLQGGEPTIVHGGNGLSQIVAGIPHYVDVLTNMASLKFFKQVQPNIKKLQRDVPYPSIRVSYHPDEMNRIWGDGFKTLVDRCLSLKDYGFIVDPDPAISNVGIYMVGHPSHSLPNESDWVGKIPFAVKDYIGVTDGVLHGEYAYPHAVDLVSSGKYSKTLTCKCQTNEILLDPCGFLYGCHFYMYRLWETNPPVNEFRELEKRDFGFNKHAYEIFSNDYIKPVGHILDKDLDLSMIGHKRICHEYGQCSFCDIKTKKTRYKEGEEYTGQKNYSSVIITDIKWPADFDQNKQPHKIIPIEVV
jgi:hypothetical protein